MTIGELIARYREEKGLSQEELAHMLGYKSRSTIHKIESGQREVPRKMIAQLSIALNVSPLDLLGENKNSSSPKNKREALADLLEVMSDEEIDDLYNKVTE
jgi:repressor LexA